jgi:hypothetical protein
VPFQLRIDDQGQLTNSDLLGGRRDVVHRNDERIEVVLDRVEFAVAGNLPVFTAASEAIISPCREP